MHVTVKHLLTIISGDGVPRDVQSGRFEALVGSLLFVGLGPTAWSNKR